MSSSVRRNSGLSCSMSRRESSLSRLTSTWSMTAWKRRSRGEYCCPTVTSTTWFLRYLWLLSPKRIVAVLRPRFIWSANTVEKKFRTCIPRRSLAVRSEFRQRQACQAPLGRIAQPVRCLVEWDPPRRVDLVVVVVGAAGQVVAEEEVDGLEDAPAVAAGPIGNVAERLSHRRGGA